MADESGEADELVDYAYRGDPPEEREGQLTRLGKANGDLSDQRYANLRWFIVRVAPQKEMAATLILERQGKAVLYPRESRYRRSNKYAKTKREVWRPLAVRYLFVGFQDREPDWLSVFRIRCINGVVGINGNPMEVPHRQVTQFVWRNANRMAPIEQRHMVSNKEFAEGQRVEILRGSFNNQTGQVTEIRGKTAMVILSIAGKSFPPVEVGLDNLASIDAF
jgi:transcription antitermination factor NusG